MIVITPIVTMNRIEVLNNNALYLLPSIIIHAYLVRIQTISTIIRLFYAIPNYMKPPNHVYSFYHTDTSIDILIESEIMAYIK